MPCMSHSQEPTRGHLASFPGLLHVYLQVFDHLQYAKRRERPGESYHVNHDTVDIMDSRKKAYSHSDAYARTVLLGLYGHLSNSCLLSIKVISHTHQLHSLVVSAQPCQTSTWRRVPITKLQ